MAPFKSTFARSVGKLLGVFKERDLSLRGATQSSRVIEAEYTLSASGGTTYTQGDYKLHVFTYPNSDSFVVTNAKPAASVEIMIIGSGGSGAPDQGNGGGGGGVVWTNNGGIVISNGTYPVSISGASAPDSPGPGNSPSARGGDTVFGPNGGITLTAKGGGFGGYFSPYADDVANRTGGCGAGMGNMPGSASHPDHGFPSYGPGGAEAYQPAESQTFPTATNGEGNVATVLSQGFPGGGASVPATGDWGGSAGGGGGAGTRGYMGASNSGITPSNNWGKGGDGHQVPAPFLDPFKPVIPNPFLNISQSDPGFLYFGGGGGGSDYNNNAGSGRGYGVPGGLGGGGRGAQDPGPGTKHGVAGLNHRGGGGGGGSTHSGDGMSGGSGCCIIKYKFQ